MASTYSPLLRLELIGSGDQAGLWGTTTNTNLGTLLEQAIAGVQTITLSSTSDYPLSNLNGAPDEARAAVLVFNGTTGGTTNIIIPATTKLYVVRNNTTAKLHIKTPSGSTYAEVLSGDATLVFCDGAEAYLGIVSSNVGTLSVAGGGTGKTTFTAGFIKSPGGTGALTTSSTVNLTSEVTGVLPVANGGTGGTLPVANGGTGNSTLTSNALLIGNGTSAVLGLTGTLAGQVATWNGATWTAASGAAAGVTSFGPPADPRTGVVQPKSTDYSTFYPTLSGNNTLTGTNTYNNTATFSGTANLNATTNYGGSSTANFNGTVNINASSSVNAYGTTTIKLGSQMNFESGSGLNMYSGSGASFAGTVYHTNFACFGTSTPPFQAGSYSTCAMYVGAPSTGAGSAIFDQLNQTDVNLGTIAINNRLSAGGSNAAVLFTKNSFTFVGSITNNGSTVQFSNPSDYRLKNIFGSIAGAAETVKKLNPVQFTWKDNEALGIQNGFIAHELQVVIPQAVSGEKDAVDEKGNIKPQTMSSTELIPTLAAALKEALLRIEVLEAKLGV